MLVGEDERLPDGMFEGDSERCEVDILENAIVGPHDGNTLAAEGTAEGGDEGATLGLELTFIDGSDDEATLGDEDE